MTPSDNKSRATRPILVILGPSPGRKGKHLAVVTHRGGGWYDVRCCGEGKKCEAGECKHISDMRFADSPRRIRPVARAAQSSREHATSSRTEED